MKKTMVKRLMSWVLAAAMVVAMLPVSVLGAPVGNVAKIGDTEYATLDEAITAAEDGATIELLGDATTQGINLHKNLTIQAAGGLANEPTITFTQYGIALAYGDKDQGWSLTFKDLKISMKDIGMTPATGEWNWVSICTSNSSITLDNVDMVMDGENARGAWDEQTQAYKTVHAIYFTGDSELNLINGTNLTIKNYDEDALEWNDGNTNYKVNIKDSTFISDNNRSGFAGTFYATIDNSIVKVLNSKGNGSNGTYYTIKNGSKVLFDGNGSWGISAYRIDMTDQSTLIATNNEYSGIWVRILNVDSTCTLDVENNGYGGQCNLGGSLSTSATSNAGISFWGNGSATSTIETGANVTIKYNAGSGISGLQSVSNLSIGSATIVNNGINNTGVGAVYGGGIYTVGTMNLGPDVVIYNNHASVAGDDIYYAPASDNKTLTFGKVGSDWVLDDCDHLIDGWYLDGEGARWQVCGLAEGEKPYAEEYVLGNETATVTGLTALKAAHGYDPVDKASYPGLDKQVKDDDENWNDDVDAAAGQKVNFQLISNVPTDLLNYLNPKDVTPPSIDGEEPGTAQEVNLENRGAYVLTFHDKLNEKLTNPENYVVKIGETTLTAEQYTLTATGLEDGCSFEISLDLAALYEDGVITDDDIEKATRITVTYDATLSADATAGTYENTAWVTAPDWETSKDIVYVNTYAIDIFKYDQADNTGLVGAEFTLTDAEGTVIATVTSGEDGHVVIDGLDAGTYYLKETQAPDGYVCSTAELEIVIPEKAGGNKTVGVNFANSQIPHTGGTGTLMFTIGGAAIIATAGVLLLVSRKKRKA